MNIQNDCPAADICLISHSQLPGIQMLQPARLLRVIKDLSASFEWGLWADIPWDIKLSAGELKLIVDDDGDRRKGKEKK